MEFEFKGICVLRLEHKPGWSTSQHVATDFNLEMSDNLQKSKYLDSDGLPTEDGSKTLTNVLVQGLVGNIHMAHERGFKDSAEHLRYIIAELERGFASVAEVQKSNF